MMRNPAHHPQAHVSHVSVQGADVRLHACGLQAVLGWPALSLWGWCAAASEQPLAHAQSTHLATSAWGASNELNEPVCPVPRRVVLCCAAGGSVTAGMGIYDAMMLCRADVQTYCFGLAASMGAFLLGAGKKGKRHSMPNSRIMIHQPLGGASGQAVDIEIQAKEIMYHKVRVYYIPTCARCAALCCLFLNRIMTEFTQQSRHDCLQSWQCTVALTVEAVLCVLHFCLCFFVPVQANLAVSLLSTPHRP
jgi:hypothetical protein